ncbi:MAG: beta-ketoacyl-[acyl-carrier-protein] synthase family protein [Oscillospiraceae bacterium]|nr:beta-ketoacyl-[acyl-carrier-protein] synthase family protein [Oscillospiraceae bacterium]
MSNPTERIVITGMGAVTPIGIGVESYWRNLLLGKSGIGPITRYDTTGMATHLAAEIHEFTPPEDIPAKFVSRMALFTQYACAAAGQALRDSGLTVDPKRTGIVLGTALGGTADVAEGQEALLRSPQKKSSPSFVPKILSNMASSQVAIAYGLRGPNYTLSTACASGDDAVGLSSMILYSGRADAMLAVGCEAVTCPVVVSSLAGSRVMIPGDDPKNAGRPFDLHRNGFVLGEGGGALLLETESHAKARGAHIYGVLLGYGNNNDAFHITTPRPEGEGGADCIYLALESAGLAPSDIDYINAHGTGTPIGDATECAAVRAVFGDELARKIPMSSLRGATGHMMAAGSITDSIACLLALRDQILPPTLHYETPDPDCPIDCVPNQARKAEVNIVMNNAFGFGGQNASLIFGKYE